MFKQLGFSQIGDVNYFGEVSFELEIEKNENFAKLLEEKVKVYEITCYEENKR